MHFIFFLRLFIGIALVSISTHINSGYNWNINFSITIEDCDIGMQSSITLVPKGELCIGANTKAFVRPGVTFKYKNQQFLCDLFGKIYLNHYSEADQDNRKIDDFLYQLNTDVYYAVESSELSLKFLPRYYNKYNPKENKYIYIYNDNDNDTIIKENPDRFNTESLSYYGRHCFLFNFLIRHYRRDAHGNWSFVGYETEDGDTSFDDAFDKYKSNKSNKAEILHSINQLNGQLNGQLSKQIEDGENALNKELNYQLDRLSEEEKEEKKQLKIEHCYKKNRLNYDARKANLEPLTNGVALVMAHFLNENEDLKYFWKKLFESIKKRYNGG